MRKLICFVATFGCMLNTQAVYSQERSLEKQPHSIPAKDAIPLDESTSDSGTIPRPVEPNPATAKPAPVGNKTTEQTQTQSTVRKEVSVEIPSLSTGEIALSIGVLAFTLVLVAIVAWLRKIESISGDVLFKLFGLIIVVGSSIFLVSAGWSQQQITPVVGLLGTAIGFVFGKNTGAEQDQNSSRAASPKQAIPPVS